MNIFYKLYDLISKPDLDTIVAYQYKIPSSIEVEITKYGDVFSARIKKINNEEMSRATIVTEAGDMTELIASVNDALLTYLDFPEKIKPRMPMILPPELSNQNLHKLAKSKHQDLVFAK